MEFMLVAKKHIKFISAGIVTVASIFLLIRTLDFGTVISELSKVNYYILILFIPIFALNMVCRAIRWKLLIGKGYNTRFTPTLYALLIGNFYNSVLPAKAGDIIRVLFLSSKAGLYKNTRL